MTDRTIPRLEAKLSKEKRTAAEHGLKGLISTPQGRAYFWSILEQTGLFANSFTANALNTAFACGEQNVGQKLLDQLTRLHPEAYLQMMKESFENDRNARARLDRAIAGSSDPADDDSA